jgi:hypothetical protein
VQRVVLATCAALSDLDPDDRLLLEPLAQLGVSVVPAAWDDSDVAWDGFDLVVLRSTWDYPGRREEFLRWAASVPRLANPYPVVVWNTDKRYLADLAAAGVPVVETTWVAPGQEWRIGPSGRWVVKPAIGAGGLDTGWYDVADPAHRELAEQHVRRLHRAGRTVMVQPYLYSVETAGETAVLFVGGEYSHAVRKGPLLDGPDQGVDGLYRPEEIQAREPTPEQLAVAGKALATAPAGAGQMLYARVDLIAGADGSPVVVELELTEPSLFLWAAPDSASRLAEAIVARLS